MPPIWSVMPPVDLKKIIRLTAGTSIFLAKIGIVDLPQAA